MAWISVNDKLPKIGDPVLIVVDRLVQNITYYLDELDGHEDWFAPIYVHDDDYEESCIYISNVTHWQPLPEPPTEKP